MDQSGNSENESRSAGTNGSTAGTGGSSNSSGFDLNFLVERVKLIMLSPRECWGVIKNDSTSVKDIYLNYILIMAAIPAVCGVIGYSLVGMRVPYIGTWRAPFIETVFFQLVNYGVLLALIYLFAMIIENLAPKFNGAADNLSAFKLIGYSMTPMFVAGFLSLIPALSLLAIIFFVYSVVVYFQGVPVMTSIPADRQLGFTIVSLVLMLITGILISIVFALVTPQIAPPMPAY